MDKMPRDSFRQRVIERMRAADEKMPAVVKAKVEAAQKQFCDQHLQPIIDVLTALPPKDGRAFTASTVFNGTAGCSVSIKYPAHDRHMTLSARVNITPEFKITISACDGVRAFRGQKHSIASAREKICHWASLVAKDASLKTRALQ